MLEPLDFDNIPNYQYIDDSFRDQAYDPTNAYSVPYTWGTVGLIYNTNYISEEDAQSWSCLWNSKYSGKILMFDNPRDAFAIAENMLGYSYNTEDEQELKNAADLLATQSPVLQAYVMDQIFDKMERGEAWAAPYYAGDYLTMVEENPDLGFSHPQEGFMSQAATFAPSASSSSTIARPMPDAPPVTMKVLCSSSSQFCFIIWFLSGG